MGNSDQERDTLSIDKEYEFVSAQVRYFGDQINAAFNIFIRVFALVVGGSIYLSMQPITEKKALTYALLSNIIVALITTITWLVIIRCHYSWYHYRKRLTTLGTRPPPIPAAKWFAPSLGPICILISTSVAAGLFWCYNPFKIDVAPTRSIATNYEMEKVKALESVASDLKQILRELQKH